MPLPTLQPQMSEVLSDVYQVPKRGGKPSSPSAEGGAVCDVVLCDEQGHVPAAATAHFSRRPS